MITLNSVSLQFGGEYLFKEISLRINRGDRFALVGMNGAGKSSLMKLIIGENDPESGNIARQNRISIGYLPQEQQFHTGKTVFDEVFSALETIKHLQEQEDAITSALNDAGISDEERFELIDRLGDVHHRLQDTGSYDAPAAVRQILSGLGFSPEEQEADCKSFSGGWQMRIALAKLLIARHDLLLLDEPTNHLDLDSLRWLISFLGAFKGALIIVSHDKFFINLVTNKTLEVFNGSVTLYNDSYDNFLVYKEERDALLEKQAEQLEKKRREVEKFIERFRYKATKARQVQSRIKMLDKMESIELADKADSIVLRIPPAPSSGRVLLRLENIDKSYGTKKVLEDITFTIERGEKIALVGPNGAGKTTFARIAAGFLPFEAGERKEGTNLCIAYYAQNVADELDPELDVLEAVWEADRERTVGEIRNLCGSFLFSGDDVFKKIAVLSGGEKSRVALARMFLQPANLLLLDEPTNHLDISSKAILQRALKQYEGAIILISHDIDFIRPLTTKIIDVRGKAIKEFVCSIGEYLRRVEEAEKLREAAELKTAAQKNAGDSRKDQKRIEAELRQQRYKATKDINARIKNTEELISSLESKIATVEAELADPDLFTQPGLAKDKNKEYNELKQQLENTLKEWETLAVQLAEIEKQFELPG